MTQCCYQCQEREMGCHSVCERYAAYRAEVDEARKQRELDAKCKDIFDARFTQMAKRRRRIYGINTSWRGES